MNGQEEEVSCHHLIKEGQRVQIPDHFIYNTSVFPIQQDVQIFTTLKTMHLLLLWKSTDLGEKTHVLPNLMYLSVSDMCSRHKNDHLPSSITKLIFTIHECKGWAVYVCVVSKGCVTVPSQPAMKTLTLILMNSLITCVAEERYSTLEPDWYDQIKLSWCCNVNR